MLVLLFYHQFQQKENKQGIVTINVFFCLQKLICFCHEQACIAKQHAASICVPWKVLGKLVSWAYAQDSNRDSRAIKKCACCDGNSRRSCMVQKIFFSHCKLPFSSKNAILEEEMLARNKKRIILFNKCDLANMNLQHAIAQHFTSQYNIPTMFIGAKEGKNVSKIIPACLQHFTITKYVAFGCMITF